MDGGRGMNRDDRRRQSVSSAVPRWSEAPPSNEGRWEVVRGNPPGKGEN